MSFSCLNMECNNEDFFEVIQVGKTHCIILCAVCGRKIKLHISHAKTMLGREVDCKGLKRHFNYEIEDGS